MKEFPKIKNNWIFKKIGIKIQKIKKPKKKAGNTKFDTCMVKKGLTNPIEKDRKGQKFKIIKKKNSAMSLCHKEISDLKIL